MQGRISEMMGAGANDMEKRQQHLEKMSKATGKKKGGGMFDFIYRAKREREQALQDLEQQS